MREPIPSKNKILSETLIDDFTNYFSHLSGRAIPDDSRYTLLASGTLRLLRVQPSDAGIFRCEAANAVGITHAQVTLTIVRRTPFDFAR